MKASLPSPMAIVSEKNADYKINIQIRGFFLKFLYFFAFPLDFIG